MTRPDWIETLRADLRPADPDPVLLAQLTQLSSRSTAPAPRPGRSAGARFAIVLGGAIAIGATSWAAGALPGTDSPFSPEDRVTQQPTDPTPRDAPTSDAPTSPSGVPEQDPEPGSPEPDAPGTTPGVGSPTGAPPASAPPDGGSPGPPGSPVELPTLPDLPLVPDVPAVPEPSGLDRVPDLPVLPSFGAGRGVADAPATPDSDSVVRRSPQPQEVLVAQDR